MFHHQEVIFRYIQNVYDPAQILSLLCDYRTSIDLEKINSLGPQIPQFLPGNKDLGAYQVGSFIDALNPLQLDDKSVFMQPERFDPIFFTECVMLYIEP